MKYYPASIERYLLYINKHSGRMEDAGYYHFATNYDFDLEHNLVEQCEAGDFIHAAESPIRDTE